MLSRAKLNPSTSKLWATDWCSHFNVISIHKSTTAELTLDLEVEAEGHTAVDDIDQSFFPCVRYSEVPKCRTGNTGRRSIQQAYTWRKSGEQWHKVSKSLSEELYFGIKLSNTKNPHWSWDLDDAWWPFCHSALSWLCETTHAPHRNPSLKFEITVTTVKPTLGHKSTALTADSKR